MNPPAVVAVPLVTMQLLSWDAAGWTHQEKIHTKYKIITLNHHQQHQHQKRQWAIQCFCLNGTILLICPAVWEQHLRLQRFGLFLHHLDHKGGKNTTCVCSPFYVKAMWPCVMQQWVAGVSARLVNKQSVQMQKGNSPDSYSYQPVAPGKLCTLSNPAWQQGPASRPNLFLVSVLLHWTENTHQYRRFSQRAHPQPEPSLFLSQLRRPPEAHDAMSLSENAWVRPSRVKDSFLMLT